MPFIRVTIVYAFLCTGKFITTRKAEEALGGYMFSKTARAFSDIACNNEY